MKAYLAAAAGAAVLGLASVASAGAATLDLTMTVDNQYQVFVSSSDSTLGTFVGSSNNWQNVQSFSYSLSGATEYIHVIAVNWTLLNGLWSSAGTTPDGGNPVGFLGTFSIAGLGYTFTNGSTTLSTDTTHWTVSAIPDSATIPTSWSGAPLYAPQSWGPNTPPDGTSPWGNLASIAPGAQWIWSNPNDPNYNLSYAEFSTEIIGTIVPEASTWTMLLSGFGALALASAWSAKRRPRSLEA